MDILASIDQQLLVKRAQLLEEELVNVLNLPLDCKTKALAVPFSQKFANPDVFMEMTGIQTGAKLDLQSKLVSGRRTLGA